MRELFEKEWLPHALMIGISYEDFWHMNPHIIMLHVDGYNLTMKRQYENQNAIAHLQGKYFVEALMATVGNMFAKKTSKQYEYPQKPYGFDDVENISQEDKMKRVENLFAQLSIMQTNFNLNHSNDTDSTV